MHTHTYRLSFTLLHLICLEPPLLGKDILLLSSKTSSTPASDSGAQQTQCLLIRSATHTTLSFSKDRI